MWWWCGGGKGGGVRQDHGDGWWERVSETCRPCSRCVARSKSASSCVPVTVSSLPLLLLGVADNEGNLPLISPCLVPSADTTLLCCSAVALWSGYG